MSSNITYDDSTITSTTPDKYEAILIYYVHENNVHEGGLYDKHYQVWAPYDGENFDAFVDLAYFTLETLMDEKQQDEDVPIDPNDIYERVVFDLYKVDNFETWQMIKNRLINGTPLNIISEILCSL